MTAFIWMWILRLWPSPVALLLFQNVIFWGGLALLVGRCGFRPIGAALALLAIGCWPSVFALLGTLWSDVLLGAALTLFVGLALTGAKRRSRTILVASILPLFSAMSIRLNALPAIIPLVVWLVALWIRVAKQRAARPRTLVSVSILLLLGMLTTSIVLSRMIAVRDSGGITRALQFSLFHDLAGIAVLTGDLRLPPHVYRSIPNIDLSLVRASYDPADVARLIYNPRWHSEDFLTTGRAEFRELVHVWQGAIAAHPRAYVRRRLDAVATILQIDSVYYPFHTGIDANDLGLKFVRGPMYDRATSWLYATRGIFFRSWVFAIIAILVLTVGVHRKRWSAVAVSSSGLLYVAPYTFVTTGSDFRYVWWLVVSALIGVLLLELGAQNSSD
ncbi:MAG: hypothetical protein IPP90_13095 [Gemmatimonadaceae bacterium]|nr:hypothetical protein [Gemmatimonadaceae bacterium]